MNTTPPRFLLVVASITVWLGSRSGEPDEWQRPARADSARSANSDAIAIINAGSTYFHKQTMLPVASKKFFVDPGTGKMQMLETRYSDYKTIDGLRIPMTIETILNGESASKIMVTEVAFTDTVDPELFAKPVANR